MDKKQKAILAETLMVIAFTAFAVVGMINFKDYVNRSETINALRVVGSFITAYQEKNGILPQEGFIDQLKQDIKNGDIKIKGGARMGNLQYRGLFIEPNAEPNEILIYSKKEYPSSLLEDGYVVLFLDGNVKWVSQQKFEEIYSQQQTDFEKHLKKK